MMGPKILGIDPSTSTGLAVLGGDMPEHVAAKVTFASKRGMDRVQSIALAVGAFVDQHQPDFVLIEGYAYGNHNNLVPLVEIGTGIRLQLFTRKYDVIVVPPASLKKWTTDNGRASKDDMLAAVTKRWGFHSLHNDVVDAYALARYGQYLKASFS